MNSPARLRAGLAAAVALIALGCAAAPPADAPWLDVSLPADARASALVEAMTLEEKAAQVGHTAPAIPRLGIPEYNWWNEGLHGVARAGRATVFPQAIGLAASWDPVLLHEVADVISTEFRAKFLEERHANGGSDWYRGLTVWSPNINIFRDPRWGRGQETYGEDPYLTGRMAVAFIEGLQGDDPKFLKTVATAKHFAVHSGPESNRHREDVHPSPHDLEDTYLPAFRSTIADAGVQSVMCAYNAVNGVPACASGFLMNERLRADWGFNGYVVSDCGAAANIFRDDALAYVADPAEGVALAFEAGMDLICGDYRNDMSTEVEPIVTAVNRGLLDEAVLDRSLERLFSARIRLGLFDRKPPFGEITKADYDTEAHRALSLKMAQASLVLLKNDGLLPLRSVPKKIAVIGPNADSLEALLGNYNGIPSTPVTVLDGIRARFPEASVLYTQGSGLIGPAEPAIPDTRFCTTADCRKQGLTVEYYEAPSTLGAPAEKSVARNVNVLWAGTNRNTAMRWTGYLKVPATGDYRFRMDGADQYRIRIDHGLLVDAWDPGTDTLSLRSVRLEAGKAYAIEVEALQTGRRGYQQLLWNPPGVRENEAVTAAAAADLVVFVAGLDGGVEGEELELEAPGFAGGDRTSLDLPAPQQSLLESVRATGTPVVLVLMSGSALGVNWADANVPAIVQAWYPGGAGGTAVAGLLAGDFSPAGRLPVTFYRSVDQLPAFDDYGMANRTYRYFTGAPLYPFGHGLSFTRFEYSAPRVSSATIAAGEEVQFAVDVRNAGAMDGDEVVQLYLARPGVDGAPLRQLAAFERVRVARGATERVVLSVSPRAMSTVDAAGTRTVEAGRVDVWIGGGQPVTRPGLARAPGVAASFTVSGRQVLDP